MEWLALVVVGVVLAVAFGSRKETRIIAKSAVNDASQTAAAIETLAVSSRPNAYNQAIKRLWDGYNRERAVQLIREFARFHKGEKIAQYWLDKALSVEPELTSDEISDEFVAEYFYPHVAQQCGSFG